MTNINTNTNTTKQEAEAIPTRDEARAKIFATRAPKFEEFDFFGVTIQLRQPTLGSVVDARQNSDREAGIIDTLVDYAYLPGSNEKLFSLEDANAFKELPFGADFIRVTEALTRLTEVNFRDDEGKAAK